MATRNRTFSRAGKRLREIERLIRDRHGAALPDTDDVDIYLAPITRCFRKITIDKGKPALATDLTDRLALWCNTRAPHVAAELIAGVVRDVLADAPKFDSDDQLGRMLCLTYADRQRLKITTIGSHDVDRAARKKQTKTKKRMRDRLRAAEKRRAEGALTREQYLAQSLSRTKPWVAMGISRATYMRRRSLAPPDVCKEAA